MAKLNLIVAAFFICAIKASNATYWPCESNSDCNANDSTCNLAIGQCECTKFDHVFSDDFTKCLKTSLFGDDCEETVQCNLMPSGANCKAGVCECADGHTYVRGRCRPLNGLDETCETDLDCYFGYDRESVVCHNQICTCANGYYLRNGNICRRKSMDFDDACVVDLDCVELGSNVKCNSLRCKLAEEIKADSTVAKINKKTIKKATSTASEATSQISKSSRSELETETETEVKTPALVNGRGGDDLTDNEIETDPISAPTSREIAVQTSIDAFELKPLNTTAPQVKNVGTITTSTSTSSRRTSRYRRRPYTRYRYDDEDKTLSTLSNTDEDFDEHKFGSSCTENGKPCAGLPHSICANSLCFCKQGYYHKNEKCFAELGEIAESADECEFALDDLTRKCICEKNYFYERSLRDCRKPIQMHLSCTSNSQCSPFGPAFCHPDIPRRCTCAQYAEYDALQQLCVYKQGLGSQCDKDEGCPLQNTVCADFSCACKDNFFELDGACAAGVGAECAETAECLAENSVCEAVSSNSEDKDKTCQCRKGFVHFKDECLKEAEELDDECIDTEQCKPLLGTCIERKCSCTDEQHFQSGRCVDKKALGEACTRATECHTEKQPENVECRNSVCQCKFGHQTDGEQKASCIRVMPNKKNSSGRPSALKIITFLLIGSAFLITSAAIRQAYY